MPSSGKLVKVQGMGVKKKLGSLQFSSVSSNGPTPKVSDRRHQVDYGVVLDIIL